ncbi:hypothetical protein M404DRAFT_34624 [Pisolithus tinctorius Marx 270]|uniref:Uncharacterized protein n=1 Tax=Pisolithus tinctorius Marx 270 TaxID=870435 RepID=A0A0C3NGW8_PISTI|nr:hypothetical protein M404DRAFT_34624 [Pisolithus tinctorius Marx 270]
MSTSHLNPTNSPERTGWYIFGTPETIKAEKLIAPRYPRHWNFVARLPRGLTNLRSEHSEKVLEAKTM